MPRKPRRATPDAGADTEPSIDTKLARSAKSTTGTKASVGAKTSAGSRGVPGTRGDLSRIQVEAIRQLALDLARKGAAEPGTVMICNPISEPSALPAKELLYDRCGWCNTDIYYDRLMPSPPDLKRVCLACGILLLEAEKKGAN